MRKAYAATRYVVGDHRKFGRAIRTLVALYGSQSALAEAAGVPQQRVSEWLRGKRSELAADTVRGLLRSVRPGLVGGDVSRIARLRGRLLAALHPPSEHVPPEHQGGTLTFYPPYGAVAQTPWAAIERAKRGGPLPRFARDRWTRVRAEDLTTLRALGWRGYSREADDGSYLILEDPTGANPA
jgi:hypothetical protein